MMHELRFGKNCERSRSRWQPKRGNMNEFVWIDCDCHQVALPLSQPNLGLHGNKRKTNKPTNKQCPT